MDAHELLMTALRALGVYVLILAVIRLLGKRTVGNFTAFDLLVALMLGEVVDEIIYGDVTFAQGTVAIVVVALAKYGTSWLSYWDHGFDKILEGNPEVIIRGGKLQRRGMRAELMSEREVMAALRVEGIEDLREVKLATVESDGLVSVLLEEWAQPVQKSDLRGEAKREKEEDTEGRDDPPRGKRTDTDYALGID